MTQDPFVFLEIAFEDLKVSKELYNSQYFPQAIFYLQQSIEKIVKYVGLKNETISVEELMKPIGHKTSKIFKKELVRQISNTPFNSEEDLFKEFQVLDNIIQKEDDSTLIPSLKEQIDDFLSAPETDFPISSLKTPEDIIEFLKNNNAEESLITDLQKKINDQKFYDFIINRIGSFIPLQPKYLKAIQVLFILTCYFEKAVSLVRYPIADSFENPSTIYTQKHILVENLGYFHKITYDCLKQIQKQQI